MTLDADTDPGAAPTGLAEPREAANQELPRAQVARLFAANGSDETTTEDIAEAADLSQRTFFRHFSFEGGVVRDIGRGTTTGGASRRSWPSVMPS